MTGGSRGIERATCRAFDSEGGRVIVHYDRNREAADEVRATPKSMRQLLQAVLASATSISGMVATIEKSTIDMLVNNAEILAVQPALRRLLL